MSQLVRNFAAAAFAVAIVLLPGSTLHASEVFRFAPRSGVEFDRTLRRTFRVEGAGVVRTESTILESAFVFRKRPAGFRLVMTPRSFRYVVNDRDVASPVWDMIQGHELRMEFNAVGHLADMTGFDEIDEKLKAQRRSAGKSEHSFHLDLLAIGEEERLNWNERILLWLSQPAVPGTKLEFDSSERSFTGEPVKSHTTMDILRRKRCDEHDCVVTHYTMVPDLEEVLKRSNARSNVDLIDARASEDLEQVIEPATMMPHYEKLTWQMNARAADGGEEVRAVSIVTTSEFHYPKRRTSGHH